MEKLDTGLAKLVRKDGMVKIIPTLNSPKIIVNEAITFVKTKETDTDGKLVAIVYKEK